MAEPDMNAIEASSEDQVVKAEDNAAAEVRPEGGRLKQEAASLLLPDAVLQDLVELANRTPVGFGITLQMGGILVSGTLVSGRTFFEGTAAEVSDAYENPEMKRVMQSYLSRFGQIYPVMPETPDEKDESVSEPVITTYVHLQNARLVHNSGKPMPGNRGVWWRGRLTAVDAWFFGITGEAPPEV